MSQFGGEPAFQPCQRFWPKPQAMQKGRTDITPSVHWIEIPPSVHPLNLPKNTDGFGKAMPWRLSSTTPMGIPFSSSNAGIAFVKR